MVYVIVLLSLLAFTLTSDISLLSIYLVMALSLTIGVLLILFAFIPVYLFTEKHLRISRLFKNSIERVKDSKNDADKRRRQEIRNKRLSAEPEEVIIPGIND